MDEQKDKWERLTSLPNECEVNPDLANGAIAKIKAENAPKRSWWQLHWKRVGALLATCALAVCLILPASLLLRNEPPVYYEDETVRLDDVDDLPAYVTDNGLRANYFKAGNTISSIGIVIDTGDIAYIQQQVLYVSGAEFEQVYLYAIVLENANFGFETEYQKVTENTTCLNMQIDYRVDLADNGEQTIYLHFVKDKVRYYMEIQTTGDAETKIQQYVSLLMT